MNKLAPYIDHTMLKADASLDLICKYCAEAKTQHFASVCVNSCNVALVARELRGTDIKTCSVIGFPLGAMSTAAKVFETQQAVADGAQEIDMVINVGRLKDGENDMVEEEIRKIVAAAKPAAVKVIIETCLLTDEEKTRACQLALKAGAAFVKTSTGFSTGGATVEDVRLMRKAVGDKMQVKASGGIRTREFAEELIAAGADRLGVGNGMLLVE